MRAALVILLACGAATASPAVDRVSYPNGKARFEFELRDGVPNGRGRGWYPNGKLAFDGTYVDGARQGRFWLYDEDGKLVAQAIFFANAEVWRSSDESAAPPSEWMSGIAAGPRGAATDATMVDTGPDQPWESRRKRPRPYFSTLDRTSGPPRAGVQVGVSDAEGLDFGAATRVDLFAHYRFGAYGAFMQLSETRLGIPEMTLAGRRTLVLAGTHHRRVRIGALSATGGLIMPVGNTDTEGFYASAAGALQRPSDVALSIPAPLGVRTAASLTMSRGMFVVQADAGIDWMIGAQGRAFNPLGRANLGVGLGSHSALITAEVANTVRLGSGGQYVQALALGGSVIYSRLWLSACLAFSDRGTTSFLGSVGRDL